MDNGEGRGRGAGLETVRALHQTVVALRAALEESRNEILELKSKLSIESIQEALRSISQDNQQLKQKIQAENGSVQKIEDIEEQAKEVTTVTKKDKELDQEHSPRVKEPASPATEKKVKFQDPKPNRKDGNIETRISIRTELLSPNSVTRSLESLTIIKSPLRNFKNIKFSKALSFTNLSKKFNSDEHLKMNDPKQPKAPSPLTPQNEQTDPTDELDNIELIFTTDDTKESDFKEQLVSIDSTRDRPDDAEMDDDVFDENQTINRSICDSKSDMSLNQERSFKSYYSYQDSSFENKSLEKDESFDRFEEKMHIIETDISKCGIQDVEYSVGRRNTCPNPLQYRPILHREAISKGFMMPHNSRPILNQSNAIRKESGAQTDISALPRSFWRSESSLAHKSHLDNITTLPSKCPLPNSRLHISHKTVEARRILLSDIGFTSMVPELSRSADHLCPANLKPSTEPVYGQYLKATDLYSPGCVSQKFQWGQSTATPSEGSQSQYGSTYPLQAPSRRCSAPVSPSKRNMSKSASSRVRFANGSLPELRTDWTATVDSGDSTDSLVDEAENYLRRSIDCIMTGRDVAVDGGGGSKRFVPRRASAPEPSDNVPPPGWQPFLPRVPRDLRLDHWVKVITHEGRVRGGRVRYLGPIATQIEQFVGVQLASPDGYCDGTSNNRRYFQCEPYHGIFVPFKKVIMGWRP